jgi:hypothetical protein
MEVVVHQDIGIQRDARKVQVVRQLAQEPLPVVVAAEDVGAAVPAAGNVIEGVGKVNAWWARHATRITSFATDYNLNSTKYKLDPAPRPRQLAQEPLPVVVAEEDVGAAVPAAGNVIEGVGKVNAWWARHAARITSFATDYNLNSTKYKLDLAPASLTSLPLNETPAAEPSPTRRADPHSPRRIRRTSAIRDRVVWRDYNGKLAK